MRKKIAGLIEKEALTVHFQPIYGAEGRVYGYEALTRVKDGFELTDGPGGLFRDAREEGSISALDMHCRKNAVTLASSLGIKEKNAFLFVNICPETLMDPTYSFTVINEIVESSGIPKSRIVFEITEESAINNFELFKENINRCRENGYKIAIDDFGAGYGGLKMLSIIEPDYVKIDRHFLSYIDKTMVKFILVDSIVTVCHRLGIKVIAEGIERDEELKTVLNMGIETVQGFYLQKPSPALEDRSVHFLCGTFKSLTSQYEPLSYVGDMARPTEAIGKETDFIDAFYRFIRDSTLKGLPVVDGGRVLGMLHRNRFLEKKVLGNFGYGFALNSYKPVSEFLEERFIMVEANTPLEEVAKRIQSRKADFIYDDICVTKNGVYHGTLAVIDLLNAIADRSLMIARGSNPLTGLPGNDCIQREINRKLTQNVQFDVCYVDIKNFKPFNDYYGFEKGDYVIKTLGSILDSLLGQGRNSFDFVGHIGGDDFILIVRPQLSNSCCEKIISEFEARLFDFHGDKDFNNGYYVSKNRRGEEEVFRLLSLSIGILSTNTRKFKSYAELASVATSLKNAAKASEGSAIVRDRRFL